MGIPVGDGHPEEHLPDAGDVLVDSLPAEALLDQLLATGDEGQRSEVGDRLAAVQIAQWTKGSLEALDFAGGLAVLDAPPLGEPPEGQDQGVDGLRLYGVWCCGPCETDSPACSSKSADTSEKSSRTRQDGVTLLLQLLGDQLVGLA
jgi:hypothetical protein